MRKIIFYDNTPLYTFVSDMQIVAVVSFLLVTTGGVCLLSTVDLDINLGDNNFLQFVYIKAFKWDCIFGNCDYQNIIL